MPSWKKLITSGSSAVLSNITLSNLQNQGSELTSVMVNTGGVVGTRELSSTAFSTMDNYVSFTAAGDEGEDQTISSGNTLTFTGTNGITTTGVAGDSVDIALNATQTGITSILNTSLVVGRDSTDQIKFGTDNQIIFRVGNADGVTFKASGEIDATSLDISGDVDIDGTLEADVITVNGTALNTVIAGVTVSNATTAAIATTSTVADTTDTTCYVGLWESATGNLGAKSDAGLTYNAGTGMLTATGLTGPLTGQAATVATITGLAPDTATTQATQAAITSAANLATVGTIGTGIWQGTEVGLGYGGTELVGETDGKIVVADGNGAPVHLDIGSSTAITILGTVATGTWEGTTVAVDQGGTGVTTKTGTGNVVLSAAPTLTGHLGTGTIGTTSMWVTNLYDGSSSDNSAIVFGGGSKFIKFYTDGATSSDLALTLDTSHNATFGGNVSGSATSTGSFGRVEVSATTLAIGTQEINESTLSNLQSTSGTNTGDVTLAGSYDYITISGQAITRNQIDLTTDVTGVLPSANLDSDTAHLSTTQTFSGAKSFTLAVNIDATTAAVSKTTGALIVDGGVGVALDVHAGGDVVAYASSDERLKDNLQVIEGSLDKIGKINGYEFDWNEESPKWAQERGHDIGVVAQEIQKVLPEIVTERTNGYLGVDYKRIIPLLIESIKELKQEVNDLKKKVN